MNEQDLQIEQLKEKVAAKIKDLESFKVTTKPKTGLVLNTNGLTKNVNLHTLDHAGLIEMYSHICHIQKISKEEFNQELETFGGYNTEDVLLDIKNMISHKVYVTKKRELDEYQKLLDNLMSEDAKRKNALLDITSKINSL
jgi:hypothetical protein